MLPRLTLFLLLLFVGTTVAHAQKSERVIHKFIKEHRRGDENFAIKIPGFLIDLGAKIGQLSTEEEEEKAAFRLLREFGTTRFVTFLNDDFRKPRQSIGNLLYSLENYHDYERWAEVRTDSGEKVTLSVRYRKEKIENLLAIVDEGDRTVVVSARADLTADELGRIVNDL